jgi:hypothetical protein
MKKSFSKYLTIALALSMAIILLALPSCRSVNPCLYTLHRDSVAYTVHQTIDTIVLRDSIFVREVQRGDTVYLTRTEYRDRWRTQLVHDTVRDTQYITQTIEHPPERYVPKFYRWCTIALWALLIFFILRFFFAFKL